MKKVAVILILIALIGSSLLFANPDLFRGQIINSGSDQVAQPENPSEEALSPDLVPDMEIIIPEDPQKDMEISATIRNMGQGALIGNSPFVYSIHMNGALLFSNTDSYTSMEPGDEFSFVYPISRAIYPDNSGNITFKVDSENTISEVNEDNNEITKEFSF